MEDKYNKILTVIADIITDDAIPEDVKLAIIRGALMDSGHLPWEVEDEG